MNFDASLLVIMGLFWVTYFLLRHFLFRPLMAVLDARETEVESAQGEYDHVLEDTARQIEGQRSRLSASRQAARDRRDEMRRQAQETRRRLLEEAKRVAEIELERAGTELDEQVQSQRDLLETQTRGLADQMVDRLMGRAV